MTLTTSRQLTNEAAAAAWNRYWWATQRVERADYADREQRAWDRLVAELRALGIDPRVAAEP